MTYLFTPCVPFGSWFLYLILGSCLVVWQFKNLKHIMHFLAGYTVEGKRIVYFGGTAQLGPKVTLVWRGQFAENICLNSKFML